MNRVQPAPLVVMLLLLCGSSPTMAQTSAEPRHITVVFRFDDYSSLSDTALEMAIFELFAARGMKLTVGVIPAVVADQYDSGEALSKPDRPRLALSPAKADLLKAWIDQGTVEAALHGFSHQIRTDAPTPRSEFIGLSLEQQVEQIDTGLQFLQTVLSTPVVSFIPPFNGYDLTTVQACEQAGLRVFSAAMWGPAKPDGLIQFIPATCSLLQLQSAVGRARASRDVEPVVVALFHETDFQQYRPDAPLALADLDQLLQWVAEQPDVRVRSLAQTAEQVPSLTAARYAQWVELRDLPRQSWRRRFSPTAMWSLLDVQFAHIPSSEDIDHAWIRMDGLLAISWVLTLLVWTMATAMAATAGKIRRRWGPNAVLGVALCLLALLWLLWLRHQWPQFKYTFLIVAVLGAAAGTALGARRKPAVVLQPQVAQVSA